MNTVRENWGLKLGVLALGLGLSGCSVGVEAPLGEQPLSAKLAFDPGRFVSFGQSEQFDLASLRQEEVFDLSFAHDSVELSAESMQTLAATAHMAKRWMGSSAIRVEIAPDQSQPGDELWKETLSSKRIENIRHVLLAFGLPEGTLIVKEPEAKRNRTAVGEKRGQVRLSLIRINSDQVAALLRAQ